MNNLSIKKEIMIDASPESVFDALTNSKEIVKYFPLKEVISDWSPGGEVLYKGELDGKDFTDYGVIRTLSRPHRYEYSYWSDNHGTERTPENHLSISYDLSPAGEGTKLNLEQNNIQSEEMFKQMDTMVWDYLRGSLKSYIEAEK